MNEIPFLIFDEDAQLTDRYGTEWFFPEPCDAGTLFLSTLRSGDRRRFAEYCAKPLFPDDRSAACEIFTTAGHSSFRYAFCEKNRNGDRLFTTVFLAETMEQFHVLMTPVSRVYSGTTERIIREILFLSDRSAASAPEATPETILALRMFPTVLRAVMAPRHGSGLCDVFLLTETVVRNLRENPLFLQTTLDFRSAESDPVLRIIDLSADLYVHILTSLLTALMTVSADHTITLDVRPFAVFVGNAPLAVDVAVSTTVRDPDNYRNDSGSLNALSLSASASAGETLLSVAAVLACTAEIETSVRVDRSTGELNVCLTINPESNRQIPGFKYRDPYRSAGAVAAEFFDALSSL